MVPTPLLAALVGSALAGEEPSGEPAPATLTVVWENDSWWALLWELPYSDARYTNGLRALWDQPIVPGDDRALARGARRLAAGLHMGEAETVRFSVEQTMYTPEIYWVPVNMPFSHPYAATMTATAGLAGRQAWRRSSLALTVGVVGPLAFGGPSQTLAHAGFGALAPEGWDQEVQTEPVVELTTGAAAVEPLSIGDRWAGVHAVPGVRARVGTRRLSVAVDGIIAVGTAGDLPAALPTPARPGQALLTPPPRGQSVVGVALFAYATAEAVAHDMVLDGGTFRSISTPGARPLIGERGFGGLVRTGPVHVWLIHTRRGPDMEFEPRDQMLGQAALAVRW